MFMALSTSEGEKEYSIWEACMPELWKNPKYLEYFAAK